MTQVPPGSIQDPLQFYTPASDTPDAGPEVDPYVGLIVVAPPATHPDLPQRLAQLTEGREDIEELYLTASEEYSDQLNPAMMRCYREKGICLLVSYPFDDQNLDRRIYERLRRTLPQCRWDPLQPWLALPPAPDLTTRLQHGVGIDGTITRTGFTCPRTIPLSPLTSEQPWPWLLTEGSCFVCLGVDHSGQYMYAVTDAGPLGEQHLQYRWSEWEQQCQQPSAWRFLWAPLAKAKMTEAPIQHLRGWLCGDLLTPRPVDDQILYYWLMEEEHTFISQYPGAWTLTGDLHFVDHAWHPTHKTVAQEAAVTKWECVNASRLQS